MGYLVSSSSTAFITKTRGLDDGGIPRCEKALGDKPDNNAILIVPMMALRFQPFFLDASMSIFSGMGLK